ncbi:hypothetical protein OEZ85_008748 [Tetradesmus obliquus]|uniref:Serine protease n=1 Tax=Tetradesmus obliquus TaxID=3088 RepID=A0ABY8TJP6_TETOB|nr:hypothetical protein OEZ85_008748 [Tetradesmus obliquus]
MMASTPPMAAPSSIAAPVGAAQEDGGRCIPAPFGTLPAQTDVTPAQVPADKVIKFAAKYPYAAIGRLDIIGGTCSGSQIGDYTVLTAAHCVYDRNTKTWGKSNWRYEPATYRDSSGTRRYPYATNYVSYFTYFNAWINEADNKKAFWYDILVVTMKNKRQTGTLGLSWGSAGYGGVINWAGYPSDTQSKGTFRSGNCDIVNDGDGTESRLVLRGASAQCLILEHGESGSPFFYSKNDKIYVRAV